MAGMSSEAMRAANDGHVVDEESPPTRRDAPLARRSIATPQRDDEPPSIPTTLRSA